MQKRAVVDHLSFKSLQESKADLSRTQSFPYSEELKSIMDDKVNSCSSETLVKDAAKIMSAKEVSSVIVVGPNDEPKGILTDRDVLKKIVAVDNIKLDSVRVDQIMSTGLTTLSPENTIFRALAVFSKMGIKHLPIVENGRVVGIITMRHILKLRYPEPMTLLEGINSASSVDDLKNIKDLLPKIITAKLNAGIQVSDIVVMLSMINQDIHRKTMDLVLEKYGPPPSPFCLFVTGSHGRLENLLTPDQDHCMIIMDNDDDPLVQYRQYYIDITVAFSDWLDKIGFAYCPGNIMCQNPIWRKSLSEWKTQIHYWVERQVKNLGRFTTLLFDARPIYGDMSLFEEMSDYSFSILSRHHEIHRILYQEASGHHVPTGFLGRFITEKKGEHQGEFEIKRSGLIFVVEAVRILALRHKIREASTLKRIEKLVQEHFIHSDDGEYFQAAYLILLHLSLAIQVKKIKKGEEVNTYINPNELSQREKETLRHAFKALNSLQQLVAGDIGELVI